MVHWDPDITRIPCLGCGEWIQPDDLVRHPDRYARSGPSWHPFHFWCARKAPPMGVPLDRCADCTKPIPVNELRAMLGWIATYPIRVGQQRGVREPRPANWCAVGIELPRSALGRPAPTLSADEPGGGWEREFRGRYELVHVDCPDDPAWGCSDADERLVYGDWLEERGELYRARFVRIVDRPGDDLELRALRARLPSSWCRRVVQTCRLVELSRRPPGGSA